MMTAQAKGILITAIINTLNEKIKRENQELCKQNRYSEQTPLHGGDMWIKLAFCKDHEIKEIAKACGL